MTTKKTSPAKVPKAPQATGDFSRFLTKHSGELSSVASLLGLLTKCIPMDPANRKVADAVIAGLQESAKRIADSAPNVTEAVVDPEVVRAAVVSKVPDMLGGLIEARVRDALNLNRDGSPKDKSGDHHGQGG